MHECKAAMVELADGSSPCPAAWGRSLDVALGREVIDADGVPLDLQRS
jgi:hypothetical protein